MQTARCVLTPLQKDDVADVAALYTDEAVRRFLGGPADEDEVRTSLATLIEDGASGSALHHWVIRLKDGSFVGTVSLGAHHDGADTEVSYQLLPMWWGQGYAGEAVGAVVEYALFGLGLARVVAETQRANLASRRLLERLGMRPEQTLERFGAEQVIYVREA